MPTVGQAGLVVASDNTITPLYQQTVAITNALFNPPGMTSDSQTPRSPRLRPALARWVWDRGYTWKEAGEVFDCSGEAVRLWCLPFDDESRRTPEKAAIERITAVTAGEVTAADFYPGHLRGDPIPHIRAAEDVQ